MCKVYIIVQKEQLLQYKAYKRKNAKTSHENSPLFAHVSYLHVISNLHWNAVAVSWKLAHST